MLKTAHAIYKDEKLIFTDKQMIPKDGTEVIVIFSDESTRFIDKKKRHELIRKARGILKTKGKSLTKLLLEERKADLEREKRKISLHSR